MTADVIVDEHLTDLDGIRGAELVGCTIEGVTGEGLSLDGARLESCRFVDCHLRRASMVGTRIDDTTFLRTNLSGVDWTTLEWSSFRIGPGLRFADCTLDYSTFHGVTLTDVVIHACRAREVDFGSCDMTGADLRFTDLTDARFDGSTLVDADLTGASGYAFDLNDLKYRGCKVSLPEAGALLQRLGLEVLPVPIPEPLEDVLRATS